MSVDLSIVASLVQLANLVKLFVLVLILFYFVFAAVVFRQITLVAQTLESNISPIIKAIALAQVVWVAVLFFLAIVLL